MTRRCACCDRPFEPRPQVPNQAFCSSPNCQRARKLHWQQDKLRTDPDYRDNQRDAQRAWFDRHPGYWRAYRAANTGIVEPEPKPPADDTGTRSQISAECFRGKVSKTQIDASLEHLLASTPPKISVQWVERPIDAPGTPTRVYRPA